MNKENNASDKNGNKNNGKRSEKKKRPKKTTSYYERVKRLLTIIQLCQYGRPKSLDLADICDVNIRTIYRDVKMLRKLGVVLSTNEASELHISSPVYLPPMQLSLEEAFTILTLCYEAARNPRIPFMEAAGDAIHKIHGILPQKIVDRLRPMDGTLFIRKPPLNPMNESKTIFNTIKDALIQHKAVRIIYKGPLDQTEFDTKLSSYRLMFSRHAWYVIGRASVFGDIRTFHIGRIKQVEMMDETYQIPSGFSMEKYLRNAWHMIPEEGPDSNVVIRFTRKVAQNVAEVVWHKTQRVVQNTIDGSILFHVQVSGLNEIAWWILGYGKEAEVLEPPELRKKIVEHIEELARIYITEEKSALNPNNPPLKEPPMKHPLDRTNP